MEGWCQQMEREAEDYDLPEEILEKIRSAVGSAQLLMSQKVQQFYRLCQQNMDPNAFPVPTFQDLAGFWDLLQLSIEDVSMKFAELQQLKANGWKIIETKINDELNHQFEAVCESVFGEVESQAVEALDLPGCFRMRSHSYLRAIQAGCSQDDDCLSLFSMSAPAGPAITSSILKPSTFMAKPESLRDGNEDELLRRLRGPALRSVGWRGGRAPASPRQIHRIY
nr:PREDICTED: disks large-associated protein 3-like [Apteryx mantelli mantelli]